jgi:hypothetical protein
MNAVVETLLHVAWQVYCEHEPTEDGSVRYRSCSVDGRPDSGNERGCRAYRCAVAVLALWHGRATGAPAAALDLLAAEAALRDLKPGEKVMVPGPVARREAVKEFDRHVKAQVTGAVGVEHPPWCDRSAFCCVDQGLGHAGRPIQVGYAAVMLTGNGVAPPMIGITDPGGEVLVPAEHGEVLGGVLQELGRTATAAA